MMDHFGIGSGIEGAAVTYIKCSRGTGRTTSLVESVKDGDYVVAVDNREARRVERLCKERGVNIRAVVSDARFPERLFSRGSVSGDGRVIFSHSWVEDYYLIALKRASEEIDKLQINLSGHGARHRETKRQAREVAKWQL